MKLWSAMSALALLAGSPATAAAQGPGALRWPRPVYVSADWAQSQLSTSLRHAAANVGHSTPLVLPTDSTAIPPTHWKAGALLGGGFLGLLGAVTGVQLSCYDGPCHSRLLGAVGGFAFGGLVGFGIGALVGGQFPAHTP